MLNNKFCIINVNRESSMRVEITVGPDGSPCLTQDLLRLIYPQGVVRHIRKLGFRRSTKQLKSAGGKQ